MILLMHSVFSTTKYMHFTQGTGLSEIDDFGLREGRLKTILLFSFIIKLKQLKQNIDLPPPPYYCYNLNLMYVL